MKVLILSDILLLILTITTSHMKYILVIISTLTFLSTSNSQISADDLLNKSIKYHDSHGALMHHDITLHLNEKRPNGSDSKSTIAFNISKETYTNTKIREGVEIISELTKGKSSITVDGRSEYTDEEKEKYRLNPDRMETMKNYYQYLWLLPLKLKDEGTIIDPKVKTKDFFGKESLEIKTSYDPKVGKDVWYFYFHPETYAMQGYRFYHVEADNDGEYIILDGETTSHGVRLPKSRKWYTHKEDKFLGEDVLAKLDVN